MVIWGNRGRWFHFWHPRIPYTHIKGPFYPQTPYTHKGVVAKTWGFKEATGGWGAEPPILKCEGKGVFTVLLRPIPFLF